MNSNTAGTQSGILLPRGAPAARAYKRIAIAIALSLVLHALFVSEVLSGLAGLFPWLTKGEDPAPVVTARIVTPPPPPPAPEPQAAPETPLPVPKLAPRPKPARPAPARQAAPAQSPPAPSAPPLLTGPSEAAPVTAGTGSDTAGPGTSTGDAAAGTSSDAGTSAQAAAPSAPPKPTRTAPLPSRARIDFELTMESNNIKVFAQQDWRMGEGRYRVRLAGGVRILFITRTLSMESEGAVTADGLRPDRHVDERNEKKTVISFSQNEKSAQVNEANGNQKTVNLAGQAADLMSLPYDLAFNPDVPVGTVFTLAIRDNFEELRLTEKRDEVLSTDRYSVNTRFYNFERVNGGGGAQVWLSLDRQWLPVKLRVVGRDGPFSLLATRYDLNPPD